MVKAAKYPVVAPRGLISCLALLLSLTLQPAYADPGVITVDELTQKDGLVWLATGFELPNVSKALPLIDPKDASPEAVMLRRLESQGLAAGFEGVIYDNRDRGHSLIEDAMFPRLPHLQFGKQLRKNKVDVGLGGQILFPAIVIGNSSTAIIKGKAKRSQPRLAMTSTRGTAQAYLTYINNHLYIYPEHRDYDRHDRFPVNWPYMLITQGSSYSDKPFLRALFMSLAALPPKTLETLREKRLVSPTLQLILRHSQVGIYGRDAYKSAQAHPAVFFHRTLAPERMVAFAAALKPEDIPPLVVLSVEEENFDLKAGLADLPEPYFNTPAVMSRIWRGPGYTRQMVVSAEDTADPNGRELEFSWVLLQGDPSRVRITPLDGPGAPRAKISIDWHDPFDIGTTKKRRTSSRVDIGVFAWNGVHESAPSIISISFPSHQKRVYEPAPNGQGMRLVSIDYDAERRKSYYDPVLHWSAPWTDSVQYDQAGNVVEWHRNIKDKITILRSPEQMADGRAITYNLEETPKGRNLVMSVGRDD